MAASLVLGACGTEIEEKTLCVYADPALETVLPLVGDKFNVMNGKNYKMEYVFKSAEDMKADMEAGKPCDVLITDSADLLKGLASAEKVSLDKSNVIAGNRLSMISSQNITSFSDIFRIPAYDEEYEEYEEIEGFINTDDLLPEEYWDAYWEQYWEEEEYWEEEWDDEDWEEEEELPPLLINENVTKIAICPQETVEGTKAKAMIDAYFVDREPVETYDLILYCDNDVEVMKAVTSGQAQVGIVLETTPDPVLDEEGIVFNFKEKTVLKGRIIDYTVVPITDCEHKEDAKLFAQFLPDKDARRFFVDFNFQ